MPCHSPHLDESSSAVPDISPGVVRDAEWLLRSMLDPDHVKDGRVLPSAVSLQDIKKRGFSVDRARYVTQQQIQDAMTEMLQRASGGQARQSEGVACFTSGAVRDIRDCGQRVFVVIDTTLPCNMGHASVYLADIAMSDGYARKMRTKLLPLLENRMTMEGAFATLACG